MTDNDFFVTLRLHQSNKAFNAGLALALLIAMKCVPFWFVFLVAPLFLMSCWYTRKAIKTQLEAGREKPVD